MREAFCPIVPPSVMRGNIAERATPTRAAAAATCASAARTSGRRRSRSSGVPMRSSAMVFRPGSGLTSDSSTSSAVGGWPVSTARR